MLEQPQTGLISRFYRQVENRLKKTVVEVYISLFVIEFALLNSKIENIVLVPKNLFAK